MARNNKRSEGRSKSCSSKDGGLKKDTRRNTRNNSSKKERQAQEVENTSVKMSKENDYGWHSKFPSFSRDAASLPFATPLGDGVHLSNNDIAPVPGVMSLRFIPTVGYSSDQKSAINRSASRFRSYLRSVQKASADYDSADIMIILLAVDSLLTFHEMCCKAYRVINLWSPTNKYWPDAILLSMGIDPSIRFQAAEFRGFINQLGINLTRFVMPANFDLNYRHQWMTEGLYLDSNTEKAQTYSFTPAGFWVYSNTGSNGSELTWLPMNKSNNAAKLNDLITMATTMLNALSNDDDVDIINGDLFAAYGREGIKPITQLNDLEVLIPKYDPVVLSMIENATICGGFAPGYTPKITQDASVNGKGLIFTPTFVGTDIGNNEGNFANAVGSTTNVLLNMHIPSPSPEAVMEATRWTVCSSVTAQVSSVDGRFSPDIFGSDVIADLEIFYFSATTSGIQKITMTGNSIPTTLSDQQSVWTYDTMLMFVSFLQCFDWAPLFYLTNYNGSAKLTDIYSVFGDLDNVTAAYPWQLNMIHEASLLSLFDVPEFAGRIERAGNQI